MNILLISRINTDNLGDRAINMSMKRLVSQDNCNIFSADLCNSNVAKDLTLNKIDNNQSKKKVVQYLNKYLKKTKLYNFIRSLKNKKLYGVLKENNFDVVLIGGGELVASSYQFCYSIYKWVKNIKKINKKTKVYLFSVGVNNDLNKNDIYYIKKALKNIDGVFVRDENSKNNFLNYFKYVAKVVPDCVFSNKIQNYSEYKRNILLYGITDFKRISKHKKIFKTKEEYFDYSYKEIKKIQDNYKDKKIELYYTTQSDINECFNFIDYINNKYDEKLNISDYKNLDELLEKLKFTYFCASPRMHGCILARIMGVEKIEPIVISNKMKSYAERYGAKVDYNGLYDMLNYSIKNIFKEIGD